MLCGFRCLVHRAVAKRVGVVTGGTTGWTHVLAENRTDDLAAVVLQHMGGVELTSLAVLLAQCAGLLVEGEHRTTRVDQSVSHHTLVLKILQGWPELVELCVWGCLLVMWRRVSGRQVRRTGRALFFEVRRRTVAPLLGVRKTAWSRRRKTVAQILFHRKLTGTRKLSGTGVEHITIVKVDPNWLLLQGYWVLLPVGSCSGSGKQGVLQLWELIVGGVQEEGIHVAQEVLVCVVTMTIGLFHHHEVMTQVTMGLVILTLTGIWKERNRCQELLTNQ